jgi:hypothetical protein
MLVVSKLLACGVTNFLQAVATLVLPLHATKNWYCVWPPWVLIFWCSKDLDYCYLTSGYLRLISTSDCSVFLIWTDSPCCCADHTAMSLCCPLLDFTSKFYCWFHSALFWVWCWCHLSTMLMPSFYNADAMSMNPCYRLLSSCGVAVAILPPRSFAAAWDWYKQTDFISGLCWESEFCSFLNELLLEYRRGFFFSWC